MGRKQNPGPFEQQLGLLSIQSKYIDPGCEVSILFSVHAADNSGHKLQNSYTPKCKNGLVRKFLIRNMTDKYENILKVTIPLNDYINSKNLATNIFVLIV